MTVFVSKGTSATNFMGNVERFSRKFHFSPPKTENIGINRTSELAG